MSESHGIGWTESVLAHRRSVRTRDAFTAHGDYLLYTYAQAPEAQKDWTATAVATALNLQSPLIDQFPATPTREQNGGQNAPLPLIDQDKILIQRRLAG